MAKFRTNHQRGESKAGGGMVVKIGLFAAILAGLFWAFSQFSGSDMTFNDAMDKAEEVLGGSSETSTSTQTGNESKTDNSTNTDLKEYPDVPPVPTKIYPTSTTGQIIEHEFFALSYSEKHEQPEWVAYELTRESLQIPNVDRSNNFRPDPKVRKASASWRDYRNSGYEKGHMAPAGDMAFSDEAMSASFFMSNMSPQISNFNGGIWRELEENVRDWAYRFGKVYVATGPVLTQGIRETIGSNEVSVPDLYYKVVLDPSRENHKAIAFIIPNEVSEKPIMDFAVSIDQVEALTGIDFFPEMIKTEDLEEKLESRFNKSLWKTSEKRYELRTKEWNKRKIRSK